jgi:hypothetical protein
LLGHSSRNIIQTQREEDDGRTAQEYEKERNPPGDFGEIFKAFSQAVTEISALFRSKII